MMKLNMRDISGRVFDLDLEVMSIPAPEQGWVAYDVAEKEWLYDVEEADSRVENDADIWVINIQPMPGAADCGECGHEIPQDAPAICIRSCYDEGGELWQHAEVCPPVVQDSLASAMGTYYRMTVGVAGPTVLEAVEIRHGYNLHSQPAHARDWFNLFALLHQMTCAECTLTTHDLLTVTYGSWMDRQGLERASAEEVLYRKTLTADQRTWLVAFVNLWEASE